MSAHRSLQDLFIAEYTQLDPGDAGLIQADRQDHQVACAVGAGAETRRLGLPLNPGVRARIQIGKTGGGTVAITCPDAAGVPQIINVGANTIATLTGLGAYQDFVAVVGNAAGEVRWRAAGSDGSVLS